MKKLLLLLSLIIVSSCGALEGLDLSISPVYPTGPCSVANYQYGVWGWAWYDCYGNPVYQRGNYGPRYIGGPRIIIKPTVKGRRGEKNYGNNNRNNNTGNNGRTSGVGRTPRRGNKLNQ